jgi:hypothetical protein
LFISDLASPAIATALMEHPVVFHYIGRGLVFSWWAGMALDWLAWFDGWFVTRFMIGVGWGFEFGDFEYEGRENERKMEDMYMYIQESLSIWYVGGYSGTSGGVIQAWTADVPFVNLIALWVWTLGEV